jgi:hypothetical protein
MAKVNHLLSDRLKKKEHESTKMNALAERSTSGQLSGFSGVFQVTKLSFEEQEKLKEILSEHVQDGSIEFEKDLSELMAITSEVKAINSQAIMLHGERIKKAQAVLKKYRDGAFTDWLVHTYGNRQTPYNFLQYYEFYTALSLELKEKAQGMPKQAIYTLASREGAIEEKMSLIQGYTGESKQEMLQKIRKIFPLAKKDKRGSHLPKKILKALAELKAICFEEDVASFSKEERKQANLLLSEIKKQLAAFQ